MKKIKIFCFVSIALLTIPAAFSCAKTSDDFESLHNAYKEYLVETFPISEFIDIEKGPDAVRNELESEMIDGVEALHYPWSVVKYDDPGSTANFPATKHTDVMLATAVAAEKTKDSRWQDISVGMVYYWIYNDFRSSNWWFNDLGSGSSLASVALFVYDDLNEHGKIAIRSRVARTSFYYNESLLTHTGSNLFDYADNTLKASIIHRNRVEFELAVQRIEQEITNDGDEGFKKDGSFFQHGKQNQTMSNYGRSVIRLANLLNLIDKTSRHFSLDKLKIITHYILKGISRGTFKGYNNYLEMGREYARAKNMDESTQYLGLEKYLELPDLPGRRSFENFISKLKVGRPTFNGITYFEDSKLITMNLDGLYIAFEGSDPNVVNTECVNGENKLGLNLSYGTNTCVMDKGDEYNDIAPLWDYAYLPGTTSFEVEKYSENKSDNDDNDYDEYFKNSDAKIIRIVNGDKEKKYYNDPVYDEPLPKPGKSDNIVYSSRYDVDNNVVCLMQRSSHHKENYFTVTCIACEDGMFLIGADLKCGGNIIKDVIGVPTLHTTIEQCHYKGADNFNLSNDNKILTHGNALYTVYDNHEIQIRGLNETRNDINYEAHGDWCRNRGVEGTEPTHEEANGKILLAYLDTNGENNKYAYSIQPVSYQDRKFELLENFPTSGDNKGKLVQAARLPTDTDGNSKIVVVAYENTNYVMPDTKETIHLDKGEFKVIQRFKEK